MRTLFRFLPRFLLFAVIVAAFAWIAWRVEFGGRTLWERVAGSRPPADNAAQQQVKDGDGRPMEQVDDGDKRALDGLLRQRTHR